MSTSEVKETRSIERFDAGKAVRRLIAGEPPQYIFGDISLLTIEDLGAVLRPDPATRKVRFTLAAAALMDAAQIVTELPEPKPVSELPSLDIDLITPQALQASVVAVPFLECASKETREAIRVATDPGITDSTLSKSLARIRRYLPILDNKKAHLEIRKLSDRQHRTIEDFLPDYYELLSSAYQKKFGTYPPLSVFRNMAENSIGILGRIAAKGLGYMIEANATLKDNDVDDQPFDPKKFELFERSDGKLVLLVKGSVSKRINTTHKSLTSTYDRAMINCPANVVGANNGNQPRTSRSFIEAVNLRALGHLKAMEPYLKEV